MTFNTYQTVALACLVLLLGYFLVKRVLSKSIQYSRARGWRFYCRGYFNCRSPNLGLKFFFRYQLTNNHDAGVL